MSRFRHIWMLLMCGLFVNVHAQTSIQTSGTLVIIPASGEVKQANDEAHLVLMVEEQDKDKAAAASRVNQKMKQGIDIIKREDPLARLKTPAYHTYPVYADEQAPRPNIKSRQPVAWRVAQYLEVTTTNLGTLSKTVASAQRILALDRLYFGLSESASKKLEEQRISTAYRSLTERILAVAKAMDRNPADAMLESMDFEAQPQDVYAPKAMRAAAEAVQVEEPSFEPGETTLSMRVVGKVRFK